jgi:fumarate hydratase subunit beta
MKTISTQLTKEIVESLNAGDEVLLNGTIFTARDAAHKRLISLIDKSERLPLDLRDQILYYTGPTPPKPGSVIGSAGPTTSGRMDSYTPKLIEATGMRGMIGKGNRSKPVVEAMISHGCVYFAAIGGAGALLSKCINKSEIVCYEDLGPEAIYKLNVEDFPVIVAIDCRGKSLYKESLLSKS